MNDVVDKSHVTDEEFYALQIREKVLQCEICDLKIENMDLKSSKRELIEIIESYQRLFQINFGKWTSCFIKTSSNFFLYP